MTCTWFIVYAFLSTTTIELNVNVNGFSDSSGKAFIAVFDDPKDFPSFGKQSQGFKVPIVEGQASYTFQLKPGQDYAIAVFHDRNNNGKLDRNFFGAPSEAYGFSNNVRNLFSAPSFEQAKISVNKKKSISIKVQ